jgi:hypothetical protein
MTVMAKMPAGPDGRFYLSCPASSKLCAKADSARPPPLEIERVSSNSN